MKIDKSHLCSVFQTAQKKSLQVQSILTLKNGLLKLGENLKEHVNHVSRKCRSDFDLLLTGHNRLLNIGADRNLIQSLYSNLTIKYLLPYANKMLYTVKTVMTEIQSSEL